MLLAVDIGNAQIKLCGFAGEETAFCCRVASDPKGTDDQLAALLAAQFSLAGVSARGFTGAAVCCVVPSLAGPIARAVERLCGIPPLLVGPGIKTGLNLRLENAASVGPDFVCGAVGALALGAAPAAVFDLGTATTVTVLDKDGALVGRLILCGAQTGLDALAEHTACLPRVALPCGERRRELLGRSTREAMESGALYGAAAIIDGVAARLRAEAGCGLRVLLTGGCAPAVAPCCAGEVELVPDLVLRGLKAIFERNRPARRP